MANNLRPTAGVTVNGQRTGNGSPLIIIMSADFTRADIAKAEDVIRHMTGRHPYTWTDGTGTTTVGASALDAAGPQNAADAALWTGRGKPMLPRRVRPSVQRRALNRGRAARHV